MSKVLYIKANPKEDGKSRTFKISDFFMEEYKKIHPDDEIQTLDLYKENLNFLTLKDLDDIGSKKDGTIGNSKVLRYAYEFAKADKYVFAAPMWNLSFPGILKAYIDYISVSGITFKYTDKGAVGLLENKKAIHIVTRGGYHEGTPYEMGDRYIKTILNFLGVSDIQSIIVEGLDVQGVNIDEKIKQGKEEATKIVQSF
ncbi:MAG: FMN-dependent NADH-azoreductase [Clostridium perfringens]|nr:FMN-dependent NADH-azoreductase [Clostridium perfringens]